MKLHNTLTRRKDELKPLDGQTVRMYTCGLTVYSQPHIGNWVGYIYWDVLVRLLRWQDIPVIRTQNITDVGHLTSDDDDGEDKMEKGARREGKTAWDIAEQYIAIAEHEAYEVLKLVRPDHLVRATDYIQQQIDFARGLDEKGFLYKIDGDGMYFDTSRLPGYGKLARLDVAGLEAGARVSVAGKRSITDFAVWKFSPTDAKRDMEWDSPWGVGFPGWHLECSTIARETLGGTIDIHTGGIDHIPVHHTNEIAQSESLTGQQFAHMWLHNNHIKVDGRKMSKSLGNIITLSDITARGFSPMAFKLAILSKHYQTEGNFTWDILEAAQARLDHWRGYAALRHQTHDTLDDDDEKDEREGTVSLLAARWANNASMLIAGKRTAVHSRTIFRSVSGVVLALFAGSFYLTATSGIEGLNAQAIKDNGFSQLKRGTAIVIGRSLPGDMAEQLQQKSYITSVATIYPREDGDAIRCQDLAKYTEHTCPNNARPDQFALLNFDAPVVKNVSLINDKVDMNGAKEYLVTLKSDNDIEKLRTLVTAKANQYDLTYAVSGTDSKKPHINPTIREFADLAYVGIGVTLFVAVASLIVSTIGGLMERRRSLYTLQLSGMRLAQLKRLVMVESAAPLLITSILSCSLGVWTGAVFTSTFSTTLKPVLTPTYFAIVGIGLAAAIIGIYLILPMVDKLTRAEANQTE